MSAKPRASCWVLFKYLSVLPFYSQYILLVLLLVVKNMRIFEEWCLLESILHSHCRENLKSYMHIFVLNTEIHIVNTWQNISLYVPSIKLTKSKNGVYCLGIVIFDHLPCNLRELSNDFKNLKSAVENLLLNQSLYSINEYLEWSVKRN
jgi:hypothetical protein